MTDHLKMFVIEQVLDVAPCASKKVVDAKHQSAARQQMIAEM